MAYEKQKSAGSARKRASDTPGAPELKRQKMEKMAVTLDSMLTSMLKDMGDL